MTRLRDALHDLAENAPRTDLTTRVTTRARHRRRVRLLTIPAVVTGVAAATIAGSLLGATPGTAGRHTAASHATKSPGLIPAGEPGPVQYAYLSWCGTAGLGGKPISGACAQWHLIGPGGKKVRVADGLGTFHGKAGTTMNGSAPLKINNMGTRIAYYRPADEHFVVRDLLSGHVTVVNRRVPLSYIEKAGAELMFSGDGRRLAISFSTDQPGHALLADTSSGAVQSLPGTWVTGLGKDASTVTLSETGKDGTTTLVLSGPDGRIRGRVPLDPNVNLEGPGNLIAPDGHTLAALPGSEASVDGLAKPMNSVNLVDVRTGKTVATRRIHLPKKIADVADLEAWVSGSTVLVTAPWPEAGSSGVRAYLADLNTGRTRVAGTLDPHSSQSETEFGGFGI
ncbi:MAG: hypothetical protein ACRDP6_39220 [Actinoallomurus sp.]